MTAGPVMTKATTTEARHRRYAVLVSAIAALSGLLFGFDTAVVNGGLLLIRAQFLTNLQAEIAAAAMIAGAVFGAAGAGWNCLKPAKSLSKRSLRCGDSNPCQREA